MASKKATTTKIPKGEDAMEDVERFADRQGGFKELSPEPKKAAPKPKAKPKKK